MDLKRIFAPPVFEDEEKSQNARFLNIVSWFIALFMSGLIIFQLILGDVAAINFILIINAVLVLVLTHRGHIKTASLILVLVSWGILTYQAWTAGGLRDSTFFAYILVILLANLLLGWPAGLVAAGLSILAGWGFAYAEVNNIRPTQIDLAYEISAEFTVIFGLSAVFLAVTTVTLSNALQRARDNEQKLAESNRELQAIRASLEKKVAARTRRLKIVTSLGERLSAILNLEDLLVEVVNQVQDVFGYYHAHIYLLDDKREKLVVAAGTGVAGEEMKARGHNIPLEAPTSLVARAARSGEIVGVDNVREAEDWLPNPLLPDTYSEMAVPIILEEQTVGILDVQEDEVAGLDEGDADLLRSLASHVAVAIRNARLFAEVETALAEARVAHERYVEQAWRQTKPAARAGQYHYTRPDVPALSEVFLAKAKQLALTQDHPAIVAIDHEPSTVDDGELEVPGQGPTPNTIVAPVTLGTRPIGALQLHPTSDDQSWTEDDLAVVEAVVDQLAQSAESLRLFEDTRERASREQTIREITDKLRAAPNLEQLVEIATEELGELLAAKYTKLELGFEKGSGNGNDITNE